jgi:hypothetical protein
MLVSIHGPPPNHSYLVVLVLSRPTLGVVIFVDVHTNDAHQQALISFDKLS